MSANDKQYGNLITNTEYHNQDQNAAKENAVAKKGNHGIEDFETPNDDVVKNDYSSNNPNQDRLTKDEEDDFLDARYPEEEDEDDLDKPEFENEEENSVEYPGKDLNETQELEENYNDIDEQSETEFPEIHPGRL